MRRLVATALVLMLAVSAAGMTACSRGSKDSGLGPVPWSAEETASVGATDTTTPLEDDGAASSAEPKDPPDAKELTDIEAELSAIEKELGSMDMPSDTDFSDIESSLK